MTERPEDWGWEIPLFTKEQLESSQWKRFLLLVATRLKWLHENKVALEAIYPVNGYQHRELLKRINDNRIYYKILCGSYANYNYMKQGWLLH